MFWLVSILLVLELLLLAGTKVYETAAISSEECGFLDKKLEIEDLEEQAKLVGYALMEKSVEESLNHIEALDGKGSVEDMEAAYMKRVEDYLSRNISVPGGRAKPRDISYIEGFVEPFESEYSYRFKSEHLSVEALKVEGGLEDESKALYRRVYEIVYILKDESDEVGYFSSPIYLVMEYPMYSDAVKGNTKRAKVEVQKKSL